MTFMWILTAPCLRSGFRIKRETAGKANGRISSPFLVILLAAAILGSSVFVFLWKRGAERVLPNAELPTLIIGDSWVFWSTFAFRQRTVERKIVGEEILEDGRACYVEILSLNEPIVLWDCSVQNWKLWFEKDTHQLAKSHTGIVENLENFFLAEDNYYYTFSEDMWPLEVGKEFTMTITGTSEVIFFPGEQENIQIKYLVKIEDLEWVTTPTGTFECFRIANYLENGALVYTHWYSPTAMTSVRLTSEPFAGLAETYRELISYSLMPRP